MVVPRTTQAPTRRPHVLCTHTSRLSLLASNQPASAGYATALKGRRTSRGDLVGFLAYHRRSASGCSKRQSAGWAYRAPASGFRQPLGLPVAGCQGSVAGSTDRSFASGLHATHAFVSASTVAGSRFSFSFESGRSAASPGTAKQGGGHSHTGRLESRLNATATQWPTWQRAPKAPPGKDSNKSGPARCRSGVSPLPAWQDCH